MGVVSGAKLLFVLLGLTLGRERAKDAGREGAPAVAGDISWLCYRLCKKTVADAAAAVTALILKFVEEKSIKWWKWGDRKKSLAKRQRTDSH